MSKAKPYRDAEAAEDSDISDDDTTVVPTRSSRAQRARSALTKETSFRVQCWRYLLCGITCCLAVALCINLWASYGDFLEDSIWPPRVSSAGTSCGDGTVKNAYQMSFDAYEVVHNDTTAGWVRLNATKPPSNVLWAYDAGLAEEEEEEPQEESQEEPQEPRSLALLDARWDGDDQLLVWLPSKKHCATVMIFST